MTPYDTVSFFFVAHMDDWQLFMNPNVIWELKHKRNKVVFIYTTGNDTGAGEEYWRANEEAAISSVRLGIVGFMYANGIRNVVEINNHLLHSWSGGNAICYFIRLPDGNVTGEGFERNGYQSMHKLFKKDIAFIKPLDQSTVYKGWQDFVNTLQGIIDYESFGIEAVSINHPETDQTINPGDHSDHTTTGIAVQAIPRYDQYHRFSFIGYHLRSYPEDLRSEDLFWKVGQFVIYDKTLHDLTKYSILEKDPFTFIGFCLRTAKFRKIL